jgi:hypothetical protein
VLWTPPLPPSMPWLSHKGPVRLLIPPYPKTIHKHPQKFRHCKMMKEQEPEPKWSCEREHPWDWSRKKLLTLSCWSSHAELISAIDGCDPPARNGLSLSHTVSIVFRDCFK